MIQTVDFIVILDHLYKMGNDKILHRYLLEFERGQILAKAHGGVASGHYVGCAIGQKILRAELWWPILQQDSKAYCRACDVGQWTGKLS